MLMFRYLVAHYRRRIAGVVGLLTLSGLAEGFGFISLLPLLGILGGSGSGSGLSGTVVDAIRSIGLEPTIGSLAVLIALGLWLKAGLFLRAMRQAGYLGSDVSTHLRLSLIEATSRAKWSYIVRQPAGALTNAIGLEALRAGQLASQLCQFLSRAIQVAVYAVVAVLVSWQATLSAGIFAVVVVWMLRFLTTASRTASQRESDSLTALTSRFSDAVSTIKAIKAMGRIGGLTSLMKKESADLDAAQKKLAVTRAALPALQEPLAATGLAVVLYVGSQVYEIPLDELAFLVLLFYRIVTRVNSAQVLHQLTVALEAPFTSLMTRTDEARAQREKQPEHARGVSLRTGIRFDNVAFSYEGDALFAGLDVDIKAGTFLLVRGPSGVGKTTFVDLLIGLLEPTQGQVIVDGVPLREIDPHVWRRQIGYVPQDPILLHTTVFSNVSLDEEGITESDVEQALRSANAWDFVSAMPDGIFTTVGERGLRLSGGQRQRLAIARALVHKPRLLVLDEATTGLDPKSEGEVLQAVHGVKGEITVVAVSHQQAMEAIADDVLVMKAAKAGVTETAPS